MITPLTRCTKEGKVYQRPPEIHAWLERLVLLATPERTEQLVEGVSRDGTAFPLETLVYFMRQAWRDRDKATFEKIFRALCSQVSALNRRAISDSRIADADSIREAIMAKFVDLISEDCQGKHDRLDFFEVRGAKGLVSLRLSALRKAGASAKKQIKTVRLEQKKQDSEEEGIPPHLEAEASRLAAQIPSRLDDPAFRSTLYLAIDSLPAELSTVLHLSLKGMPIEVADPNTMTIVSTLKCTRRTVQNRYTRAVLSLQALLGGKSDE